MELHGINLEKWNKFVCDWQTRDAHGCGKYLHLKEQIDENMNLMIGAGLQNITNKQVLDISSGIGIWLAILKNKGNAVMGTDNKGTHYPLYQEAFEVLDLDPIVEHKYVLCEFNPLPDIGKFDLISSIAGTPMTMWGEVNARKFINDCINHLYDNGILFIAPNNPEKSQFMNIASEFIIKIGARKTFKIKKEDWIKHEAV